MSKSQIQKFMKCACPLTANPQIFMLLVGNTAKTGKPAHLKQSQKNYVLKQSKKLSLL
jgi:hypothetical protein